MRRLMFALALMAAACAAPAPAPDIDNGMPQPTIVVDAAAACAASGGDYRPVCRRGLPMCVTPYKDAGKPCTDNDQCEGQCRYEGDPPPNASLTGQCQADNQPCGCSTSLAKGKPTTICVD